MRIRVSLFFLLTTSLLASAPGLADDVSGSDRLLCSANEATVCILEGDCEVGSPWIWGIPQFIVIDLVERKLSTTEASGENRSTPIKNLERADGTIYLQGVENGRAFSIVVNEATGLISAAVARDGMNVGVFGACTTWEGKR